MHTCFSCQVMIYSSDRSKNTYYFVFVLYKCGLQLLGSISREGYLYTCFLLNQSSAIYALANQFDVQGKPFMLLWFLFVFFCIFVFLSKNRSFIRGYVSTLFYFKRFNRPQMGKPIQCYSRTCSIS